MRNFQAVLCILLLSVSISANAQTADSSSSEAERTARQLLSLSGGGKLGVQVFQQLMNSFKQSMPSVPDAFWDEVSKQVNPDDLAKLAVPIYVKHFTIDEMKSIMAFYKTPVGTKLLQVMPEITQEMMLAGQQWGKEIGQKVLKKLKDEGYQK